MSANTRRERHVKRGTSWKVLDEAKNEAHWVVGGWHNEAKPTHKNGKSHNSENS